MEKTHEFSLFWLWVMYKPLDISNFCKVTVKNIHTSRFKFGMNWICERSIFNLMQKKTRNNSVGMEHYNFVTMKSNKLAWETRWQSVTKTISSLNYFRLFILLISKLSFYRAISYGSAFDDLNSVQHLFVLSYFNCRTAPSFIPFAESKKKKEPPNPHAHEKLSINMKLT